MMQGQVHTEAIVLAGRHAREAWTNNNNISNNREGMEELTTHRPLTVLCHVIKANTIL